MYTPLLLGLKRIDAHQLIFLNSERKQRGYWAESGAESKVRWTSRVLWVAVVSQSSVKSSRRNSASSGVGANPFLTNHGRSRNHYFVICIVSFKIYSSYRCFIRPKKTTRSQQIHRKILSATMYANFKLLRSLDKKGCLNFYWRYWRNACTVN